MAISAQLIRVSNQIKSKAMETNKKSAFEKKACDIVDLDKYKGVEIKASAIEEMKKYMDELFEEFMSNLNSNFQSPAIEAQLRKAYDYAFEAHWEKRQIRKTTGEFYITHPVAVAMIVANEIGLSTTSVEAALLHDVVEDTGHSNEEIKAYFGDTVADIVAGLTKITGVYDAERNVQAETFKNLLLTIPHNARVVFIKLADRLHNMRTMEGMPAETSRIKSSENLYVFVPLAKQLGLYDVKNELEDTSFKYYYPEYYQEVTKQVDAHIKSMVGVYSQFKLDLMRVLIDSGFTCKIVSERKTYYTIWNEYKLGTPIEDCNCEAIRVVFQHSAKGYKSKESELSEYYQIFSSIICNYKERENSRHDYVVKSMPNGFKALTVQVYYFGHSIEVQIISEEYEQVAHKGYSINKPIRGGVSKLQQQIGMYDADKNAEELIAQLHLQLSLTEIYVFTPGGQIRTLAQDSTVLDFAYSIHTDIGNHCIGAYIGRKLVPLNYTLNTADRVTVLTSPSARPQPGWIHFVRTARAANKINEYLRRTSTNPIPDIKRGEMMFHSIMSELKIRPKDNTLISKLIMHFHLSNCDDFFRQIASQEISRDTLITAAENINNQIRLHRMTNGMSKGFEIYNINYKKPLVIDGNSNFIAADCCHPICGDDALAFLDKEHILYVHRRNCSNAQRQLTFHGKETTSVIWQDNVAPMLTAVELTGSDRQGIIRDISVLIDSWRVNIQSFEIGAKDDKFVGTIKMMVKDVKSLHKLASQLNCITNVESVKRVGPNNSDSDLLITKV